MNTTSENERAANLGDDPNPEVERVADELIDRFAHRSRRGADQKEKPWQPDDNGLAVLHERRGAGKHGNGHLSGEYWKLEVRTTGDTFQAHTGMLVDSFWRVVPMREEIGDPMQRVPVSPMDSDALRHAGLSTYVGVQAARFTLLSHIQKLSPMFSVQTRLVKVKFNYEYTTEEIGVTAAMMGVDLYTGDSVSPRWTKPEPDPAVKGEES